MWFKTGQSGTLHVWLTCLFPPTFKWIISPATRAMTASLQIKRTFKTISYKLRVLHSVQLNPKRLIIWIIKKKKNKQSTKRLRKSLPVLFYSSASLVPLCSTLTPNGHLVKQQLNNQKCYFPVLKDISSSLTNPIIKIIPNLEHAVKHHENIIFKKGNITFLPNVALLPRP